MEKIYLDNAATSKVKPKAVREAMINYYDNCGCSPGRGGYKLSLDASRILLETRSNICKLFNINKPKNVILTHNITYALNMIIKGLLTSDDHVITTSMEHNAVIRPLNFLKENIGLDIDYVKANKYGEINSDDIKEKIKDNTKCIITTHASNVVGTYLPIKEIGDIAKENNLIYVLDAAQTAGSKEINLSELNIDILAFTGHKGLFGPTGTGGFILNSDLKDKIDSYIQGGTGSISDKDYQPDFLPDKFESGTSNTIGLAGLNAGIKEILEIGVSNIYNKKKKLTKKLIQGFEKIEGLTVLGTKDETKQTSTISVNLEGFDLGQLSFLLDDKYNIMTRSGLHCAPYAHKTIKTYPEGTLRFSIGYFNTEKDIDVAIKSLKEIVN